eukprot:1541431-Rhodomonas_salina.1
MSTSEHRGAKTAPDIAERGIRHVRSRHCKREGRGGALPTDVLELTQRLKAHVHAAHPPHPPPRHVRRHMPTSPALVPPQQSVPHVPLSAYPYFLRHVQ